VVIVFNTLVNIRISYFSNLSNEGSNGKQCKLVAGPKLSAATIPNLFLSFQRPAANHARRNMGIRGDPAQGDWKVGPTGVIAIPIKIEKVTRSARECAELPQKNPRSPFAPRRFKTRANK
jgi:hypothetical protein